MKVQIPCTCPPKANGEPRHAHDTVVFRDRLNLESGLAIRKSRDVMLIDDPGFEAADFLAVMSVQYMVHGIESWTRTDEKGKAIPCNRINIRQFISEHDDIVAEHLVDPADDLYAERHLLPLVKQALASSQPSPTEPSTSAETGSEVKPRKPSRRSSTSTTRTDGITPITSRRGGDSSTSRKSA